jgi:hypothetical protein
MKITQGDQQPFTRALQFRGGTTHFRHLLQGDEGTAGNFMLVIVRSEGDFFSPRHRHNFEQYRYVLDGQLNYSRNGKLTKGMLGYFPEGVMYGPQTQDKDKFSLALILQFGGTSGNGFLSRREVDAEENKLRKIGEFKNGVFHRNPGVPGKKNMDAMQAIWESANGRPLEYPKPRIVTPPFMDPANYEWTKVDGASGVSERLFAVSAERGSELRMLKIEAGSRYTLRGRAVYFTMSGSGTVGNEPLRTQTSIYTDTGESVEVSATETVEILQLGMPNLGHMTVRAGDRVAA